MRRLLLSLCLFGLLLPVGCAFNRADFVCGPDGRPTDAVSDDGKTTGGFLSYLAQVGQIFVNREQGVTSVADMQDVPGAR